MKLKLQKMEYYITEQANWSLFEKDFFSLDQRCSRGRKGDIFLDSENFHAKTLYSERVYCNFVKFLTKLLKTTVSIAIDINQRNIMKLCFVKTSQDLRMLSRSLSDCISLLLSVVIQVSEFVTNSLNRS